MQIKRIATIVGLIVIITGLAIFIVKHGEVSDAPDWLQDSQVTKVDTLTGDTQTKSWSEWGDLGHVLGKYKNDATGDYTMIQPITCASCSANIIPPEFPGPPAPDGMAEYEADRAQIHDKYKCPKCGERAY